MGKYTITVPFEGGQAEAEKLQGDIARCVGPQGVAVLQNHSWLENLRNPEVCNFPASNQEITSGPPDEP